MKKLVAVCLLATSSAFVPMRQRCAWGRGQPLFGARWDETPGAIDRRDVLSQVLGGSFALVYASFPAFADSDESLTSKLFNPDGSLKDASLETEARFRTVSIKWDASDAPAVAVDGTNTAGTPSGSAVEVTYNLPEKWGSGTSSNDLYMDRSEGVNEKACSRITVYQAAGKATMDQLSKATRVGVAKALDVTDDLKELKSADLIGGRSRVVSTTAGGGDNEQRYYEFDMAIAPKSCGESQEDLGLGFCPYEYIYLLSATVLNDRLYVCCVQSDKLQWKRASSDLRRVRSSFTVRTA